MCSCTYMLGCDYIPLVPLAWKSLLCMYLCTFRTLFLSGCTSQHRSHWSQMWRGDPFIPRSLVFRVMLHRGVISPSVPVHCLRDSLAHSETSQKRGKKRPRNCSQVMLLMGPNPPEMRREQQWYNRDRQDWRDGTSRDPRQLGLSLNYILHRQAVE